MSPQALGYLAGFSLPVVVALVVISWCVYVAVYEWVDLVRDYLAWRASRRRARGTSTV